MMARKWWLDSEVVQVDVARNGNRGLRIALHPGNNDQEPLLQVAHTWQPADGIEEDPGWVPLKNQPAVTIGDLLNSPDALRLLRWFIEIADKTAESEAMS